MGRAETRAEREKAIARARRMMRNGWGWDESSLHDARPRFTRGGKLKKGLPSAKEVKKEREHRELMARMYADNRRKCSCAICQNEKTRTHGLKASERRRAGEK